MRRTALIVLVASSTAHADVALEDQLWTRPETSNAVRRDLVSVTAERFERSSPTTVDVSSYDATGHVIRREHRANPSASPSVQELAWNAAGHIERIHSTEFGDGVYTYKLDRGRILTMDVYPSRPEFTIHVGYTWRPDGSHATDETLNVGTRSGPRTSLTYDRGDKLVEIRDRVHHSLIDYDMRGNPERLSVRSGRDFIVTRSWTTTYDRYGGIIATDDGTLRSEYHWNTRSDVVEIDERRGGAIVAKTVYTYVYR